MLDVLHTFGHGTATVEEMLALLRSAGIATVVDVRSAPGSRHNPHVARSRMADWLGEHDIDYAWDERLGGWRRTPPNSPDSALRNKSFRGYAAHMRTAEFTTAIDDLLAHVRPVTVLCSESVWWRCHRSMIADFVTSVHSTTVRHLMHDGRTPKHRTSEFARIGSDGLLTYDIGQRDLWS